MRKGILRRFGGDRRGNTAVEFGLLAFFFFNFVFGVVEFMSVMRAWSNLQWSVDLTARYAMANQSKTTAELSTYAANLSKSAGYPPSSGAAFAASTSAASTVTPTRLMTITGTHTYTFRLVSVRIGSVRLSATAVAPLGNT